MTQCDIQVTQDQLLSDAKTQKQREIVIIIIIIFDPR